MPFISLTEKYKCSKVRLQLTLNDSKDQTISKAAPPQSAGQKWTPTNTEQKATSTESRRHGGACPAGTKRLWPGGRQPTWHTVTTSECRILVAEEVHQQEETARSAKAGSLAKWKQWMGGNYGKWKQTTWALSLKQHMTCYRHLQTESSGLKRIQPVPPVQQQQLSNTSRHEVKAVSRKATTPGNTIRS